MAKQPLENVVQHLYQIAAHAEFKTLNDQQLLKRYVECHDELAFGELVCRYKRMVWYVCWHVLRQHQDVEDAFQATIMTLVRRAESLLGRETLEGWLHRAAFKIASTAKRDQGRQRARAQRSAVVRKKDYESDNSQWELSEALAQELIRIPEKYRSPLLLCYLEGLTQKEAAQRLGITVDALDRRLRQGRDRLKARLSRHGMEWGPTMTLGGLASIIQTPEISPDLVERTLEMARILRQTNGLLEAVGISTEVAVLAKSALGVSLKAKLLLGSMLLSLAVVTAGAAKYVGILHWPLRAQRQAGKTELTNQISGEPEADKTPQRVDYYGDPLPKGALARLGTERFRKIRHSEFHADVVFTPDSKAIGLLALGDVPRLWDWKTGKPVRQFGDSLRGQPYASSQRPISQDGRVMAYRGWGNWWSKEKEKAPGIYVRETTTGKLIRYFEDKSGPHGYALAISPDGKALVAGIAESLEGDQKLCSCDIGTGQRYWEQKLKWNDFQRLRFLAFSPDGKILAIGFHNAEPKGKESSIELRDARTGRFLRTLGHSWDLSQDIYGGGISFSPDGRTLAVVYITPPSKGDPFSEYRSIYFWDANTGKERWHLDKGRLHYTFPTFSPDGKIIALYEQGPLHRNLSLYEAATGKKLNSCQPQAWPDLNRLGDRLTFSPDGKLLATVQGSQIRCWDVSTGEILAFPPFGHESAVGSVAFVANGETLISGGLDQSVHLWNSLTGQKQRTICEESRPQPLQNIAVSMEMLIHAVSADGKIVAGLQVYFDIPSNEKLSSILPAQVQHVLLTSTHGAICIWDSATGRELRKFKLDHPWGIRHLALSPDGKYLAVCMTMRVEQPTVSLWELGTGKQIVHNIEGAYPTFSPDSMCLLTLKGGAFTLWKTETGKKIGAANGVDLEAWSKNLLMVAPDWQTLVSFTLDKKKQKKRWNLSSLHLDSQSHLTLLHHRYFDINSPEFSAFELGLSSNLALSRDGKMMAWSRFDGSIRLVETTTGSERARFEGHGGTIRSLSFSPDGYRLASGSEDTTILVWDVTGGWLDNHGHLSSVHLSDQQVQQFWSSLAGTDAARAGRAIWTLAAAPQQTVPFLSKHLTPVVLQKQPSAQRITRLVKDLEDDKYPVRQKAFAELSKLGQAAEVGIRQALDRQPSLEVGRRLKQLLGLIEDSRSDQPTGEVLRCLRAIEVLERMGTPEACKLLKTLSQGVPGVLQTREAQAALQRLRQPVTGLRSIDVR